MSTQFAEAVGSFNEREPEAERSVQSGAIVLDKLAHTVSVAGAPVALTTREFALLDYLLAHPGQRLTRAKLLGSVWGPEYGGGARTVDIHVARLRRKLGAAALITTVRRVGYRFELPSFQLASEQQQSNESPQ